MSFNNNTLPLTSLSLLMRDLKRAHLSDSKRALSSNLQIRWLSPKSSNLRNPSLYSRRAASRLDAERGSGGRGGG
jgi:hypothetical protein